MKKLLYLMLIAITLQSGFCRKECDSYIQAPIRGEIEEYFGAYKPGNWWIYKNNTGTKKDSIYVTNFNSNKLYKRTGCYYFEERFFAIRNTFLMNGNNLYVRSSSFLTGVTINFSLDSGITQGAPFPHFAALLDSNKIYSYSTFDNPGNNRMDSISLNGQFYYNILVGKYTNSTYYFAKSKGLVGWIANGETFNLTNFKIQ